MRKITDMDMARIKILFATGAIKQTELAMIFNISAARIWGIINEYEERTILPGKKQ
jgi:hypothetical protein